MKKVILNTYVAAIILSVGVLAFISVQAQNAFASLKKQAAKGESIRITERNACDFAEATTEKPHFSGCNSII